MKLHTPVLALACLLLATAPLGAQGTPQEIPFDSVSFGKLPTGMYFGEAAGVAVNSKGHVFVFSRGNTTAAAYAAGAAQLLEFDAAGNYVREIGHHLYAWAFAHGVRVDKDDNVWTTDKGSDMVVKFNPAGRVAMVLGRKREASDDDTAPWKHVKPPAPPQYGLFRQVTDVAWDSKGNSYVSDGYINSRVVRFDPDGVYLGYFGEPGSAPGQLQVPHSIAIDASDNIYVADRNNRRIQVFDTSGKLERIITIDVPVPPDAHLIIGNPPAPDSTNKLQFPGAPWAVCITPASQGTQYLFVADAFPGRIYKLSLDGQVLGYLGREGKQLKQFGWVHEIACPTANTLFVAELLNWRVQKLTLHAH